jgi:hypothetical protein
MTTLFCSPSSSLPSPQRQRVVETPPTGNDVPKARSTEADGADPSPSPANDVTIAVAGAVSGQLAPSAEAAPPPAVGSVAITTTGATPGLLAPSAGVAQHPTMSAVAITARSITPALPAPSICTPTPPTANAVVKKPLRLAFRDLAITRSHV